MIVCSNCETCQFLQITKSRIFFEDGELVYEIEEEYECTLCDGTGTYTWTEDDGETVTGDVEQEEVDPEGPTQ